MSITVECEHCGSRLKMKDDSKVGKKLPCPKCKKPFLVQEVDEEFEVVEEEDEAPAPKKKAGKGSKGKKGKKSKSSDGPPVALIGGIVALLLVAIGVGLWAMGVFGGGGEEAPVAAADPAPAAAAAPQAAAPPPAPVNPIDFSYLPAETDVVITIRSASILNTPLVKESLKQPELQKSMEDFQKTWGVAAENVTSWTISLSSVAEKILEEAASPPAAGGSAGFASPFSMMPGFPGLGGGLSGAAAGNREQAVEEMKKKVLGVIRTSVPIDLSLATELDQANPLGTLNGTKIFGTKDGMAILLLKPDVLLVGDLPLVEQCALRTDGSELAKRFASASQQDHQIVVGVSLERVLPTFQALQSSGQPASPSLMLLKSQIDKGVRGLVLGAKLTDSVGLRIALDAPGASDKLKGEYEPLLTGFQSQFTKASETIPAEFREPLKKFVGGIKFVSNPSLAGVDVSATMEQLVALQQGFPVLVGMAMSGAFTPQPEQLASNELDPNAVPDIMRVTNPADDGMMMPAADGTMNYTPPDLAGYNGADPAGDFTGMDGYDSQYGGGAAPQRAGGLRSVREATPLTKGEGVPAGINGMVAASSAVAGRQPALQVDLLFVPTDALRVVGYTNLRTGPVSDDAGNILFPVQNSPDLNPGPHDFAPVDQVALELPGPAGEGPKPGQPAQPPQSRTTPAAPPVLASAIPVTLQGTSDIRQLSSGNGSVRLQLASTFQSVVIDDLHASIGQLSDASEPGSLGVRVERGSAGELILFSSRPDAVLTAVKAVDANDRPLASVSVAPELRGAAAVYTIRASGNQPLPIPLTVRLDLATALSVADVNYEFGPVKIPGQQPVKGVTLASMMSERNAPEVEGATIRGQLRWGPPNEKKIPTLEIAVQMTGAPFENAVATGRYADEGARVGTFKLPPIPKNLMAAYQKRPQGFDPVDPRVGCEAVFGFAVPPRGTFEAISSFGGTVRVKRASTVTPVFVPALESALSKPLASPELEAAKLSIIPTTEERSVTFTEIGPSNTPRQVSQTVSQLILTVDDGDYSLIRSITPVSENGAVIPVRASSMSINRRKKAEWSLTLLNPEHLAGAGLRIELYSDISEVAVPFLFKELKVPPRPNQGGQGTSGDYPGGLDGSMSLPEGFPTTPGAP